MLFSPEIWGFRWRGTSIGTPWFWRIGGRVIDMILLLGMSDQVNFYVSLSVSGELAIRATGQCQVDHLDFMSTYPRAGKFVASCVGKTAVVKIEMLKFDRMLNGPDKAKCHGRILVPVRLFSSILKSMCWNYFPILILKNNDPVWVSNSSSNICFGRWGPQNYAGWQKRSGH